GQPWLMTLKQRLRRRVRLAPAITSNAGGIGSPRSKALVRKVRPDDWRQPLIELAQNHEWSKLLNRLATQFAADGWPDLEAVGTAHQQPQFALLVRDTQALHYGAEPGSDAQQRLLGTRWVALLNEWEVKNSGRKTKGQPARIQKLYPD